MPIKLTVEILDDKIVSSFKHEEMNLTEASMLSLDLQRILRELTECEWEGEDTMKMSSEEDKK